MGVMVVMEDGEFNKSDYRKFIIGKGFPPVGGDISALKEMLERRLKHTEWLYPNIIVLDGGLAQLNTARKLVADIPLVAITKDKNHKPKAILGDKVIIDKFKKEILLINNEAHRFAIKYHRSKRKTFMI